MRNMFTLILYESSTTLRVDRPVGTVLPDALRLLRMNRRGNVEGFDWIRHPSL
jgi:hypothetical protein